MLLICSRTNEQYCSSIGGLSYVVYSRSDNQLQGRRILSAVSEKKALGLGPLIGQTVHKVGHICLYGRLGAKGQQFGTSSRPRTPMQPLPPATSRPRSRQLPESH